MYFWFYLQFIKFGQWIRFFFFFFNFDCKINVFVALQKFPVRPLTNLKVHLSWLSFTAKYLYNLFTFSYGEKRGQDNDLSEFDESREIIESLVDEYKACESPDYIKWGMEVRLLLVWSPSYIVFVLCSQLSILYFCAGSRSRPNWRRECYGIRGSKLSNMNY